MTPQDLYALKAAYLYSQRFSQAQIASVLHCSQSTASRYLKHAETMGWLKFEVRFEPLNVPKRHVDEVKRFLQPAALFDSLSKICSKNRVLVRNLRVYKQTPGTLDERMIPFGRMTAGRVVELIEKSSSVGVYLGQTIHALIEGIAWSGLRPKTKASIQIVPVAGEMTGFTKLGSSSTALANRLHELVNGDSVPQRFSLSSVPFWIAVDGDPERQRWVKEWIQRFPVYQAVFGGQPSAVDTLDCLITSFGWANHPLSAASKEVSESAQMRIASLAAAEIGGVLIPREHLRGSEIAELDELSEATFGLRLRHIESLAERASHAGASETDEIPGVCVAGIGANKAVPLLAILERGLCNELLVDDELALALQTLIERRLKGS